MSDGLDITIESLSPAAIRKIDPGDADLLWLHLAGGMERAVLINLIAKSNLPSSLACVFVSGELSEEAHDAFDDVLEVTHENGTSVLTVWSEDSFDEAAWEFLNVYGSRSDIHRAKILLVAETNAEKMVLLRDLSAVALGQ
jgi:uncharacterized SAM-dependent methyltransferase